MPHATAEFLDKSPTTLAEALKEVCKGEVMADPFTRSLYATDASIYEIEPLVVVHPLDELDVRSVLWFGQKHGVPVIARGGGSGLTGESLGKAIIMDLSVHMNRIVELDKATNTVTVQTGIVLDSLNRALAPYGVRFGPDPASSNRCTIGGMIANNSSGARSLKYGDTRMNLVEARVCFMDGTVTVAKPYKLGGHEHDERKKEEGFSGKIYRELPEILKKNAALIDSKRPKAERNRSGYLLYDVLKNETLDVCKLICGCEGTLGVVTQAVLKVEPIPQAAGLAAVYFESVMDAAKAILAIRETKPVCCELLDQKVMALGRQARPDLAELLPENAGAMLIIEFEGYDEESIASQLKPLEEKVKTVAHQSIRLVSNKKDQDQLWATRSAATPLLFKRGDTLQPVPIVEDAAVPPAKLGLYLEKAGKIFEKYKLEWSAYAHAGSGEVHIRPMMDLHTKEHVDLIEKVAGEVHAAAWECEGTISGEHGEGLARAQWIEKQAGKELYAVYKEVKSLFDPSGLLNPDKKITADAHLVIKNLRFGAGYHFSTGARPKHWSINPTQAVNWRMFKSQTAIRSEMTVEALAKNPSDVHFHGVSPLIWHGDEMARETEKCNGCGHCRTTGPEEDMCPRFKYHRVEDASPRAKANLLRRMMSGRQVQGSFSNDEVIEIMDTCFNCKLCHDGCPSNVNIPKIVMEAKARYHQAHGLPLDKWFFTQSETWLKFGSYVAPLANMLLDSTVFRFALEKIVGVDRRRPLPKIRTWKLRRRNPPSANSDRPKVVLYLDLFAKYNAPEIAQAAIDVLEHNGFEVEIPDVPWTNMPALENGALLIARNQITEIARVLAPYAFRGIPIVTPEPTAALCFKEEFLNFVDTPETRALQRHSFEISEFLLKLHHAKKLNTEFRTMNHVFAYNQACHQKALHVGMPGVELVRQIPGVSVVHLEEGCCGIAGTFGMLKKNYDESMFIGKDLFTALQDPMQGFELGMCESSTCRIQMEHGSGKQTLHPIQILASAYGYESANAREDGWAQWDKPQPVAHDDDHAHEGPVLVDEHSEHSDEHGHGENDEHAHDDQHSEAHDEHEHAEHHEHETAESH